MLINQIVLFFQAEDGIRDHCVTGVQTCALPILKELPGPVCLRVSIIDDENILVKDRYRHNCNH